MKKLFLLTILLILKGGLLFSQVAISTDGSEPHVSAVLDLQSANQGFLLPRVTTWQQKNIDEPASGLMIYNLDSNDVYFYNGLYWLSLRNLTDTIQKWICGDSLFDIRDMKVYATVKLGTQCWMAENLSVGTRINGNSNQTDNGIIEKYCYDDLESNCDIYGGLYQWDETMQYSMQQGVQGICPPGWHVPSDEEWKILEGTVDSQYGVGDSEWDATGWRGYDAGETLKSTNGWSYSGNGTDLYGFTALPGGYRGDTGSFNHLGNHGLWWSSTENNGSTTWTRNLHYGNVKVARNGRSKTDGYSLRCLKD